MSTTGADGSGDAFVYGLRFPGLAGVPGLPPAVDSDPAGPTVTVRQVERPSPPAVAIGPTPARSVRTLQDGRHLELDPYARDGRIDGTATFHGAPLEPADLAHPYLTPVASAFTRWNGREAFHSGVVVLHGQAWMARGVRTAGKSSLLAALAGRGIPVLADDMAMTDGAIVHAGPRSIDLRHPVPDVDLPHRPARGGTRHRLPLGAAPRTTPLGGWLFLHWTDDPRGEVELRPIPAGTLLSRLARARAYPGWESDPSVLLSLALRPAFDLIRPRRWDAVPDVVAAIDECSRPAATTSAEFTGKPRAVSTPSTTGRRP